MILGLVCARAGSTGLPGKNLLRLDGVPLIERAIEVGFAACDDVAVTTDYRPGRDFDTHGAFTIPRPYTLAGSRIGKWPVYQHAVHAYESETGRTVEVVVDVDVSRPLRAPETVKACVRRVRQGASVAMAVAPSDKHPAFDILRLEGRTLHRYEPSFYEARQELPPAYLHAGCYAVTRDALMARASLFDGWVEAVEVGRRESFDVDDALDWMVVRALHAA